MFRYRSGFILFAALIVAPGVVRAEDARAGSGRPATLLVEQQKLRVELERVNAEIDSIKRDKRGLRDDYRLRARMADAEALARRLTDLDARVGNVPRASSTPPGAQWLSPPIARPSDDRADLEAKADILSDQSRRLSGQADALAVRLTDLRGRQELRRRAGQLERDPFSPLEQAKRRIATTVPGGGATKETAGGRSSFGADSSGPQSGGGGPVAPPVTGTGAPGATVSPPGGPIGTGSPTDSSKISSSTGSIAPPTPAPMSPAPDAAGSVAAQFREVLDAATLAEIRRLEAPGSSAGALPAMERAVSALRGRAAQLAANANALRTRAKTAR